MREGGVLVYRAAPALSLGVRGVPAAAAASRGSPRRRPRAENGEYLGEGGGEGAMGGIRGQEGMPPIGSRDGLSRGFRGWGWR